MRTNIPARILAGVLLALPAAAQTSAELTQILDRLNRLEEQNRQLVSEVHALREELSAARAAPTAAPPSPSVEEKLSVQDTRIAEQAQSKVEASQRFPIRVTGMALFNAYRNSSGSGGAEYPTAASPEGERSAGATLRQTVLGLDYTGPTTLWGGKVDGSLRVDFFGSTSQYIRLRTGDIRISWANRSILAGVEKPLVSPRDPESFAQVGVPALTGAGNLWFWSPQVRVEQSFRLGDNSGIRAQAAVIQTHEASGVYEGPEGDETPGAAYFEAVRPGIEGRVELFAGAARRIEIAPSIHHSVSHINYISIPSDVYSVDWLVRPWQALEFTGAAFTGQNVAPLGAGANRQGFVVTGSGSINAVHSRGGWGQLALHVNSRLWFNLFSGQQDDRNRDLADGSVGKNLAYGANVFYRLAPNVLASFEASQYRTDYLGTGTLLNNHYDLALAYLF